MHTSASCRYVATNGILQRVRFSVEVATSSMRVTEAAHDQPLSPNPFPRATPLGQRLMNKVERPPTYSIQQVESFLIVSIDDQYTPSLESS